MASCMNTLMILGPDAGAGQLLTWSGKGEATSVTLSVTEIRRVAEMTRVMGVVREAVVVERTEVSRCQQRPGITQRELHSLVAAERAEETALVGRDAMTDLSTVSIHLRRSRSLSQRKGL